MKKASIIAWLVFPFIVFSFISIPSCHQNRESGAQEVWSIVSKDITRFELFVSDTLLPVLEKGDHKNWMQVFVRTRQLYKPLEPALEYFMPATAKGINGAAIPEVEAGDNTENEPTGLQVMEEILWGDQGPGTREALVFQAKHIKSFIYRARQIWDVQHPSTFQFADAIYMALVRIAAMGITGFDTPDGKTSLGESALVIRSVMNWLGYLVETDKETLAQLNGSLEKAAVYLENNGKDFDGFDRATFLRTFWQPAFEGIAGWREPLIGPNDRYALLPSARNLFGPDALNLAFFAPDSLQPTPAKMALGESLFYDTRLSKNGRFSCATCHQPDKYFTDQIALSANIHGNPLPRNTPTLVNAAYQTTYFWDMRAWNLELQAKAVIDNALEMHGSIDSVCRLLNRDEKLLGQVREAYRNPDININAGLVTSLLAIYQRSLTGLNSPFDRYMLGNEQAISPDAVAGFNLFMGKAKCGTCHFIPLFSGLVPPDYNKMESEIIGTPSTRANHSLHNDSGRYHINPVPAYLHAFKTPTVRNASFTFPYMHNGVYHTLEEVVDFYNKGGGEGTGYSVPGQTLPSDPLNLTETESKQLVAFINSLTDEIGILSQVAKGK